MEVGIDRLEFVLSMVLCTGRPSIAKGITPPSIFNPSEYLALTEVTCNQADICWVDLIFLFLPRQAHAVVVGTAEYTDTYLKYECTRKVYR